jgi:hypothetical protein
LGKELKLPVYVFLKEALVRAYGNDFYNALDKISKTYFRKKKSNNK